MTRSEYISNAREKFQLQGKGEKRKRDKKYPYRHKGSQSQRPRGAAKEGAAEWGLEKPFKIKNRDYTKAGCEPHL